MNNVNNWIEHLQHPLVLAGFGLFVFAGLLKPLFLNNKKLSGAASERLLRRGINFIFILALLAVISGFALSWKATPVASTGGGEKQAVLTTVQPVQQLPQKMQGSGGKEAGVSVEQDTHGNQSPAINSGQDVRVNYGNAPVEQEKEAAETDTGDRPERQKTEPMQVKQVTQGEQSPAINAEGNVEINYAE